MTEQFVTMMMNEITDGASLSSLCNYASEAIGNPVALSLTSETIIAHSKDFTRDFITEFTTTATGNMTEEEMRRMRSKIENGLKSEKPQILSWPYIRHKQINCGCLYGGKVMGNLLIPASRTPVEKVNMDLVIATARCIAIWMAAHGYHTGKASKDMQNFLKGLLLGEAISTYQRQKIPYFEPNQSSSFRVIYVTCKNKSDPRMELRIARLAKSAKKWWHTAHDNGYVILIDASVTKPFEQLESILDEFDEHACISDAYSNVFDTHTQYWLLSNLQNLSIVHNAPERLLYANDYKLMVAVNYSRAKLSASVFTNEILEEIIKYDQQYDSFYLETLRSYFRNNHDYAKMAEELHIKKNSVFYRMNRIFHLFHVNPNNTMQMGSLLCCLLIRDMLL